jgi:Protein of unknown function (DUF1553)/Protein of unknown function (DUF1549)/Concanavalin A-like lectin/glucanases superfamily/Planctomycete cytochrome C
MLDKCKNVQGTLIRAVRVCRRCRDGLLMLFTLVGCIDGISVSALANDRGDDTSHVRFNRDIRPILVDKCFACHGPDEDQRQADLRLDQAASAYADRDGRPAIQPHDPAGSELISRIETDDESLRMPPAESGHSLTSRERELLRQWILQGGEYESHWSFVTPEQPPPPEVQDSHWPRNSIDRFVLNRLEREGLQPSPEANRTTLIRRLTLDLTGLPPTPAEVDAFVADPTPDASENLVDRLLDSPRYGERMALEWLDAARYADTHGYLFDTERSMWRWRDQVIESFNLNQPFDEFTVEQLAGDLLPDATLAQQIASGFNRNHIINNEAGATPEEYYVENIVDRINTTATVWMGLTMACGQCHDHKFDPISQREYYQLYAFFDNVPELGLDGFNANAKPLITAPTHKQREKLDALNFQLAAAEKLFAPLEGKLGPAREKWEAEFVQPIEAVTDGLTVYVPCEEEQADETANELLAEFRDGSAKHDEGIFGNAVSLDGQRYVELGDVGDFDLSNPFSLSAWVYQTTVAGRRSIFSRMEPPTVGFRGYTLQLIDGAPALFLVHEFPENLLQVQAKNAIEPHQWHHILASCDGSGKVDGVKLFVDGELQETGITIDKLTESFQTEKPLQVGNGYPAAKFVGRIDEVRVYDRVLNPDEIQRLPGLSIHSLLAVDAKERTAEQTERIRNYYLGHAAPSEWRDPYEQVLKLREEKKQADRGLPTVMVMNERKEVSETKILVRGAYNSPGEPVSAATPAFLPPMNEDLPRNRLGLARWLTDSQHPLTARVTVNRFWQMYFGTGLVRTTEDFGLQGEWPSHPQLLDWLAIKFVRSGWDVKQLQRLIVTSATYRQSSRVSSALLEQDPDNRLLARGPRYRLKAEFIRDQALAVSGLLVERLGGPSVKPYQPSGLWKEVAFDVTGKALTAQVYEPDTGDALYRRSMYTFWKRTSPPPTMLIFDAPDRERCVVRRERTSTPLQALVLMNDPTHVEASRKLAERLMTESGPTPRDRITFGFRLVTSRFPEDSELVPLLNLLAEQLPRFAADSESAKQLLSVGESSRDESLSAFELAAYTVVAGVLLNLDETVTKG